MTEYYHYTECGLDNVWLVNGYLRKETAYGSGVSVKNAKDLHEAIGLELINKAGPLSNKEFRFLRVLLNLSQTNLAAIHGVKEGTISNWERGATTIPKSDDSMLRVCFAAAKQGDTQIAILLKRINYLEQAHYAAQKLVVAETNSGHWETLASPQEQAA